MSKHWELTRGEAEYIVDILEAVPEDKQATGMSFLGHATANDLAAELRMLFGMSLSKWQLDRLKEWAENGKAVMGGATTMSTTRQDIEKWFDRGVAQKARHMLIVCDSFEYVDYPVFTTTDDECLARHKNPGEMQQVMEVYDLRADKAEQMNEHRAMRLPALRTYEGP